MLRVDEPTKVHLWQVCSEKGKKFVRYSLNGGGCSGLIGKWNFEEEANRDDYVITLRQGVNLLIDSFTYEYVQNASITLAGDIMPTLRVDIPNANSCGCGESFQINKEVNQQC